MGEPSMICYACQNGTLVQKFPDTISCPQCGSTWKNYGLGKGVDKAYRRSKYKAGRT